jgi:hypothetical protein
MDMIPSDWPRGGVFLAAIFTNTVNLKSVTGSGVIVSASNFLLQLIYFVRKELHRTAALGTNHMVMAAPVVLMFIAGDAIVESDFAGQSAFRQQLESAVYRCVADAGVFLLDQPVQFIG